MKQLLLLALSLLSTAWGQAGLTLSSNAPLVNGLPTVQAGSNVTITETFAADGHPVSEYQSDLTGPVTLVSCSTPVPGKSAQCNAANLSGVVLGYTPPTLSNGLLPGGPTMNRVVTIPASTPAGTITIGLVNIITAAPGLAIPSVVTAGPPLVITVTVPKAVGDLNADGKVDYLDIGLAVLQVLKISPCTTADINADGVCTVADLRLIFKAAGF